MTLSDMVTSHDLLTFACQIRIDGELSSNMDKLPMKGYTDAWDTRKISRKSA